MTPSLRIADWLIVTLAHLEREYGHATLLMGEDREHAVRRLASLNAQHNPHGHAIINVSGSAGESYVVALASRDDPELALYRLA